MPTPIDEPRTAGLPVVKRQRIGDTFVGAVVDQHQRDVLRDGARVMNDRGKPRQELVVTCVTMPGTTAVAGIGDHSSVPEPGALVRLICRGRQFGDWIESKRDLPAVGGVQAGQLAVGDVVTLTVDHAQAYDANGRATGPALTRQEEADRVPRGQPVGFYGPLTLRRSTPAEADWEAKAEQAHADRQQRTPAEPAEWDDEAPF